MSRWRLSFDVASVLVFVVAGRSNHGAEETATGVLHTAGPFLIALVVGWAVTRAWQDPAALRTGGGVLAITILVGMTLRRLVFDDGIQPSFVLVTTAFLALFFLGWRTGAMVAGRRREPQVGSR
jgi:hypothetical protein